MKKRAIKPVAMMAVFAAVLLTLFTVSAEATIDGIDVTTTLNLTAKVDHVSTPDGGSVLLWGYALDGERAQYPGPTLIVNQGETVSIALTNALSVAGDGLVPNVSIVFPGQEVTAVCSAGACPAGTLTMEAGTGGDVVTYSFTATHAGTYMYQSGTNPALQIEMGLVGAIIVRPTNFDAESPRAYGHVDSSYDREYLFFTTEMDPRIHQTVEFEGPDAPEIQGYLDNYFPNYWFFNGRNAPDTLEASHVPWLPTQPYNIVPQMHPGEKLLMRVVGAGRDRHPFHHHGNHSRVIAQDGRFLESAPGEGADLSTEVFTITTVPGKTTDAIFEWTGKDLGWDMYGHALGDPLEPNEYALDHGKPLPVILPEKQDLAFGGFWSGSPFLGAGGSLPPGEGGLNPNGAFTYMWHSHTEKELTNYDIFPGGMMTMMFIEAPGVPIP